MKSQVLFTTSTGWSVAQDRYQFIVGIRRDRKDGRGGPDFKRTTHHGTLEQAPLRLARHAGDEATTVEAYLADYRQITDELVALARRMPI